MASPWPKRSTHEDAGGCTRTRSRSHVLSPPHNPQQPLRYLPPSHVTQFMCTQHHNGIGTVRILGVDGGQAVRVITYNLRQCEPSSSISIGAGLTRPDLAPSCWTWPVCHPCSLHQAPPLCSQPAVAWATTALPRCLWCRIHIELHTNIVTPVHQFHPDTGCWVR